MADKEIKDIQTDVMWGINKVIVFDKIIYDDDSSALRATETAGSDAADESEGE
jgi:hypothetical protein